MLNIFQDNLGNINAMSEDDIIVAVQNLMIDIFDVDDIQINHNTVASDIEEWDSLSQVRLMVSVERSFKIRFDNAEIESLKNVGDLVKAIAAKVSA